MHLRTLTIQAVGPFAGRHTVDFAALAASGLFLLEGPTGAGKSTLIDAVVFALYGKVAASDASDERLRSAFADDDTETVVDLTFEVPSGVYRVRRSPAYDRAKRRGTGTVRQQARITLWRLPEGHDGVVDPDDVAVGEVLSTRLDEAGDELRRVVGLDRSQFVQTIVLPQGEFARFLRADPEERRALLQRIFGTEVFERVQHRLVELRREASARVDAAAGAVRTAAARFVGAAALDGERSVVLREAVDEALGRRSASAVRDVLDERVGLLGSAAAQCRAAAQASEAGHVEAAAELARVATLAGLAARRDALRSEHERLVAQSDEHEALVRAVSLAHAARAVLPVLDGRDRAVVALESAVKALDAASDAAPADLVALAVAGAGGGPADELAGDGALLSVDEAQGVAPADPRAQLRRLRAELLAVSAGLARAVGLEAGLEERRRQVRTQHDRVDDLTAELAAHDGWLAGRPDLRAELDAQLTAARAVAARLEEHRARVRDLTSRARAVVALEERRTERTAAEAVATAARDAARAAARHESALRQARIDGLAAELAETLADGDACPVCGSADHPAPATRGAGHVSAEEVALAEDARAEAERALEAAAHRLASLTGAVRTAEEALGGVDPARLGEELAEAAHAVDEAEAAAGRARDLVGRLAVHDRGTEARAQQRDRTAQELAATRTLLDVQVQALAEAEAEVVAQRDGHPTVVARQRWVDERASVAETLSDALATRDEASRDAETRESELRAALAEHAFASAQDVRAAAVPARRLAELEAQVTGYRAALERVTAGLRERELAQLPATVEADVTAATARERAARDASVRDAAAAATAERRAADAGGAAAEVAEAASAFVRAAEEADPIARLAGLASGTGGDNTRALSLASYVLARRFEDVVAAANDRLLDMSDGRYELARSDRKEDVGSRRTGLSMRVLDHVTETERDPRSLSGGETFYVSLCLALGMADVVTAEAGGIELGTLFVDEGFGSLDPHVLENVLAALGRLRAGGRVVGVVSHVEALKQAVADRVEVRPTGAGPSTLTVLAG